MLSHAWLMDDSSCSAVLGRGTFCFPACQMFSAGEGSGLQAGCSVGFIIVLLNYARPSLKMSSGRKHISEGVPDAVQIHAVIFMTEPVWPESPKSTSATDFLPSAQRFLDIPRAWIYPGYYALSM